MALHAAETVALSALGESKRSRRDQHKSRVVFRHDAADALDRLDPLLLHQRPLVRVPVPANGFPICQSAVWMKIMVSDLVRFTRDQSPICTPSPVACSRSRIRLRL